MKVGRKIKITEKFTTHVPHLNELYHKKIVDKPIFISKYVKHPQYGFLNKSESTVLMGIVKL